MVESLPQVREGIDLAESPLKQRTAVGRAWHFTRRWPIVPSLIVLLMVLMAVLAPWLAPYDIAETNFLARNAPPFWYTEFYEQHPDLPRYFLGADPLGRDIWSRLMHGARISLTISVIAAVTGVVVGTALGLVSGYFGGVVDETISRFVDIWYAIPFILVAMIAAIIFKPSLGLVLVLLSLLAWSGFVRNVRAETLTLKEQGYVALARVSGASTFRILIRHILPGTINTIIVITTIRVGTLILSEATLSYLGAGIPSPTPAWGLMVSEGREYLRAAWWVSFFPGISIVLLVLALNFTGDWLRDRFDPRLRQLG